MAIDPKSSRFWRAALRSGLVDAEALTACLAGIDLETCPPETFERRLARRAVDGGKLTLWQAQQLLLGRWQGMVIGKYILIDALGQGGMGRVYLARDTRLRREVAMKVLSAQRSSNPRTVARFEREARIGGQLQHEHLIRVYDDGEIYGQRFLVMEYIAGRNVAQLIAEHRRLAPGLAAELGRQVALGLDHLNQKGLLHRDISPSNILVDRDGTAKLTDLGLAFDLDDGDILTREGSTVGTFEYVSPEQIRDSRGIDIRSDIYALGCCLYHMISGQVPFPAYTAPEKLLAHQVNEAAPLAGLEPSCPAGLEAVVRRMMRKTPEERYLTPADVARALEPYASGPTPLDRIGGTPAGGRGREADAYTAVWFDSGSDPGAGSAQGSGSDAQDVFSNVELDASSTPSAWPIPAPPATGRLRAVPRAALMALAVLAALLAVGLVLRP